MNNAQGSALYSQINNENSVATADRHKLIDLLLTGAIDNLGKSRQALSKQDIEHKCLYLSKAFNILDNLRLSLDNEKGGEIAENLDKLYEYMQNQIIDANLKNIQEPIEEVVNLLKTIQSGWQGIAGQTE